MHVTKYIHYMLRTSCLYPATKNVVTILYYTIITLKAHVHDIIFAFFYGDFGQSHSKYSKCKVSKLLQKDEEERFKKKKKIYLIDSNQRPLTLAAPLLLPYRLGHVRELAGFCNFDNYE